MNMPYRERITTPLPPGIAELQAFLRDVEQLSTERLDRVVALEAELARAQADVAEARAGEQAARERANADDEHSVASGMLSEVRSALDFTERRVVELEGARAALQEAERRGVDERAYLVRRCEEVIRERDAVLQQLDAARAQLQCAAPHACGECLACVAAERDRLRERLVLQRQQLDGLSSRLASLTMQAVTV